MFDKLLGSLDLGSLLGNAHEVAEKFGIPADTVQPLIDSVTSKLGQGGDPMAALMEAAQEHGLSTDTLKAVFQQFGQADTENPVEGLAGLLSKGLFGDKG